MKKILISPLILLPYIAYGAELAIQTEEFQIPDIISTLQAELNATKASLAENNNKISNLTININTLLKKTETLEARLQKQTQENATNVNITERYIGLMKSIKTRPSLATQQTSNTYETLMELKGNRSKRITRSLSAGAIGFFTQTAATDPWVRSIITPNIRNFITLPSPEIWKPYMPDVSKSLFVAASAGFLVYWFWPRNNPISKEFIIKLTTQITNVQADIKKLKQGYNDIYTSTTENTAIQSELIKSIHILENDLIEHKKTQQDLLSKVLHNTESHNLIAAINELPQEEKTIINTIIDTEPTIASKIQKQSFLKRLSKGFNHKHNKALS